MGRVDLISGGPGSNMITLVGVESIKEKKIISIGPITSKELDKNSLTYEQCSLSSNKGILRKLLKDKGVNL